LVGTTQPNEGSVNVTGRIAAILELGMGFHPDFTGRENASMACRMAGLTHTEIDGLMPGIEKFSELGAFMDQPLRIYSTGMQMRLAFSAATVVRPEILIVDEALAVGDSYFQHKCVKRIRSYQEEGTTLLFVSHDPGAVKTLCQRAILLDDGTILKDEKPDAVFDYYNALIAQKKGDRKIYQGATDFGKTATRSGSGQALIVSANISDAKNQYVRAIRVGAFIRIKIRIRILDGIELPTIGIVIRDRWGNDVFGTNTHHLGLDKGWCRKGEELEAEFQMPLNLGCGSYSLSIALHAGESHLAGNYDWWDRCLIFEVKPGDPFPFIGTSFLPVEAETRKVN
jgi:lipopolysaccharide transport system ATP-binding protein